MSYIADNVMLKWSFVMKTRIQTRLMFHIVAVILYQLLVISAEQPPLYFSQEPQTGTPVEEFKIKILTCQSYSSPQPTYRWMKGGQYVSNESQSGTFRMYNINRTAAGDYRCQAKNPLGSILSKVAKVEIAYLDQFPSLPEQDVTVITGRAVKINLPQLQSYPSPNVFWKLNGGDMAGEGPKHQVTLSKDLILLDTHSSDNDNRYQAEALNGLTGASTTTHIYNLRVTDVGSSSVIGPEIVIPPKDTTASQGDISVAFECIVNARPINTLSTTWYRVQNDNSAVQIATGDKYVLSGGYHRQLIIKSPEISDNGVYRCVASMSSFGGNSFDPFTAEANLTVFESPAITSTIDQQYTRDYSQDITIPCTAQGTPKPTIHWYFNSKPLQSTSKLTISADGTLKITALDMADSGVYVCFARNDAGETKKATWIKVNSSPPEIVNKPQNLTMVEGNNARFPCEATGAPKPTVTWKRITGTGSVNIISDGRYQVLENGHLLITTTVSADSGHYFCNASNSRGSKTAEAFLQVYVKTKIIRPPLNTTVIKGSPASLQCAVTHDPEVQITWHWFLLTEAQATPEEITTSGRHTISTLDGTLTVTGVRNTDVGTYICHVISNGGNDTGSAFLQIKALPQKPVVTSVSHNPADLKSINVTWVPGSDGNSPIQRFILKYRKVNYIQDKGIVDSDPWTLFDSDVTPSSRWMIINGLTPARYYQVQISAVNGVGESDKSDPKPTIPILMPEQAPSAPPKGVYASPSSNSSIMLVWQSPPLNTLNGDLIGYMIRYKLTNYPDSTYQSVNTTNEFTTTYELRNLITFQSYEIQIAAYNRKGVGVFSSTVEERTMEGRPTQRPRNVRVSMINSTTINVTWKPVDPAYINGVALGYKIKAVRVGQSTPEREVSVSPNQNNPVGDQIYYITGLGKYTNYSVTVLCYTSKGNGPASSPITVRTDEDVPGQVATLNFENVMDTSLKVVWTAPTLINGILLGYTLQWEKKNQSSTRDEVNLNPDTTSYTIRRLTPTTKYTIMIFAKTIKGSGEIRSADIESGVPPESPRPPHNLGVSDIQARSVLLQFLPGFDGKTSITTWIVQAQVDGASTWAEIYRISDPDATSITVLNLRPYTLYRMRIIAVNIVGPSNPSEPSRQFQTSQDSPNVPPDEVTVRAVNSTALRVSWAPLSSQDWNGNPRGYKIFYKQENLTIWKTVNLTLDKDFYIIWGLEEWMVYQVRMQSYNDVGTSGFSPIESERTRDAKPSHGPQGVVCVTDSSTSINCTWGDVPYYDQNGIILGYKVYYKDLSSSQDVPSILDVPGNTTKQATIPNLRKSVLYEIQVLAYTRMGNGELSQPPITKKTLDDVPGPPVVLWFPEVTFSSVKIMWSPPLEPNGIITGYMVSYRKEDSNVVQNSSNITASRLDFTVASLERDKYYIFSVKARTRMGWGAPASAKVYTMLNRSEPYSPTKPQITSDIKSRAVTITWQPRFDGYAPVRNHTIEYKRKDGVWTTVQDTIPADMTSYTITGLHPNTAYTFRVAANNDVGSSPFSEESNQVTTLQDKPEGAPVKVLAVPVTTNSIKVTWQQPPPSTWNGDMLGYVVQYRKQSMSSFLDKSVAFDTHSTVLDNLEKYVTYDVRVLAFNSIGDSPHSTPFSIYVGDAAPSAPPQNVRVTAKNATALIVQWDPPPSETQNGKLSGYKVSYWPANVPPSTGVPTVVPEQEVVINGLENYSNYSVTVLAYNTAGDGPYTAPVYGRTTQWRPGRPRSLDFYNITMTSLNVTWQPPSKPNGIIQFYDLTYLSHADGRLVKLSDLKGSQHHHWINKLEENVTYTFTVVAKTVVGPGPSVENSIRTGPQKESPQPPKKPSAGIYRKQVQLSWKNGEPGNSPIIGYYIQARGAGSWVTIQHKRTPEPETSLAWPSICSAGGCQFSVIAFNNKSISYPSPPSDPLSELGVTAAQKPFHYEWWFQVIVALGGLVVILLVISLLCLVARNKRNDLKKSTSQSMSTALEPFEPEDGGFASVEVRQSRRSLARIGNGTLRSVHSRGPPRPSPASVTYSEDLEGAKGPLPDDDDDDASSSVTEKPSQLGDSTEPSDDESDVTDKPFPEPPASPPPPPFRNPYINDPVSHSWRQQSHNYNAYTYTDSEADSSHYAMSLNGGQVIMNNAAGSRAPLPGFSSFV